MRSLNRLSAIAVKKFPAGKYADGGGLWLFKREDESGNWFLRFTIHGRRREMGLGAITEVSLKEARETADKWRAVLRTGKDPIKTRDHEKREAARNLHLLADIAKDAFEARKAELKGDGLAGRWFTPLELHVLPKLGKVPVGEIDQRDIRDTLAPIWHVKADTARKAMNRLEKLASAHAVRMISDIVPNPFVGREIVGRLLAALSIRGFDAAKLGKLASLIVEELRKGLNKARTLQAEKLFKEAVASGRIQFRLRVDGRNWRMPFTVETTEPDNGRKLVGKDGGALKRSLFAPVYEQELNKDEQAVAVYLGSEETLKWWHRNVARHQYGLQGWKRGKVYPDFIFSVSPKTNLSKARTIVLETKGEHLDNLDTAYKRELLKVMSNAFQWDTTVPAGTLSLTKADGETVECTLILMNEWNAKLPDYLKEPQ